MCIRCTQVNSKFKVFQILMCEEVWNNYIANASLIRNSDKVKVAILDCIGFGLKVEQAFFFVSAINRNITYDFPFAVKIKIELIGECTYAGNRI